jgi:RHS repeat-associated protein
MHADPIEKPSKGWARKPLPRLLIASLLALSITVAAFTSTSHGLESSKIRAGLSEGGAVSSDNLTRGESDESNSPSTEMPTWLLEAIDSPLGLPASPDVGGSTEQGLVPPVAEGDEEPSAFPKLSRVEAVGVLGEKFPTLLNVPVDPAPPLQEGERITGYPTPYAATLESADGETAVAESLMPLVATDAEGKQAPVDLSLHESDQGLEPANPLVPIIIGRQLTEGFRIPSLDLALTPADPSGEPLQGSATIEGAVAHYANTQVDTDTLVKPAPAGFQTHSILRSPASPEQLRFSVGVEGDEDPILSRLDDGSILVEADGRQITTIPPPIASDATGSEVPVAMEIEANRIVLSLDHRSEKFRYPIDVDPTAADWNAFSSTAGNWVYTTNVPGEILGTLDTTWADALEIENHFNHPYPSNYLNYGDYGAWFYQTQGVSRIYQLDAGIGGRTTNGTFIAISGPSGNEGIQWLAPYFGTGETNHTVCAKSGCPTTGGSSSNAAVYELIATESGTNYIYSEMMGATVRVVQDQPASITFNTTNPTIVGKPNALYQGGGWIKSSQNAWIGVSATDPGLGLSSASLTSPGYGSWNGNYNQSLPGCVGVQCDPGWSLNRAVGNLPEGERQIKAKVSNAAISSELIKNVKIDNTGPTADFLGLGGGGIVGLGTTEVTVEVTDGTAPTKSSGVGAGQTSVSLDGKTILSAGGGGCSPGPCTIEREFSFVGRDIGVGDHMLAVTAVDQIGNKTTTEFPFVVIGNLGPTVDMGPGELDIRSGDFFLTQQDVTESAAGATLSLTRTHESLRKAGEQGPLGPSWHLSFGAWRSLRKMADGTAVLSDTKGRQVFFDEINNGYFYPSVEYPDWRLRYFSETQTYKLTSPSEGSTSFRRPTGAPTYLYTPSFVTRPDGTQSTSFSFEYVSGVIRPKYVIAPPPEGVEFGKRGSRFLSFSYDSSTTASGNAPGNWGNFKGRLSTVTLTAWDPESGAMVSPAVAEYAYDAAGRLRAVWDPRISPALKTTYGYDADGRVTALTPPGQQPWVLKYGSVPGSSHDDWLLVASRTGASEAFGNGEAPQNSELPHFAKALPIVGSGQSVWNGAWSNDPLGYTYQWSRCGVSGNDCVLIPGASDQTYKPTTKDLGHRLVATVTATNAGGSTSAPTAPSGVVMKAELKLSYADSFGSKGSGNGQFDVATDVAVDPTDGTIWVADDGNNRIQHFTAGGGYLGKFSGCEDPASVLVESQGNVYVACGVGIKKYSDTGQLIQTIATRGYAEAQVSFVTDMALDSANGLWVASQESGEVKHFAANGAFLDAFSAGIPWGIAVSPSGEIYVSHAYDRVTVFDKKGNQLRTIGSQGSGDGQFNFPSDVEVDDDGYVWVADARNDRVQVFNEAGDYISKFGEAGTGEGQFNTDWWLRLAVSGNGDIWVDDQGNSRMQKWSKVEYHPAVQRSFKASFGSKGSGNGQFDVATDVAVDPTDGTIWVADDGNNRIQHFTAGGGYLGKFSGCEDPASVLVESQGNVYVACGVGIKKYSDTGQLIQTIATRGYAEAQVSFVTDMALDSANGLWVASQESGEVKHFAANGAFLDAFSAGIPWGIAVSPSGEIYVSHAYDRVTVFDKKGNQLRTIGSQGSGDGQFNFPSDVEVDDDGYVWVADARNDRVQVFNEAGDYISKFGEAGTGEGQFNTDWWLRLAVSGNGDIWVDDQGNSRMQKWSKPAPEVEETPPPPSPTTAVWTAVYEVPLFGPDVPKMTAASVTRWGQSTVPVEATAIFPPDQVPARQPANYKRATIFYMDANGQIVNTRSPGDRISTEEHDQYGNVIRTLTPENRARSLAAGTASKATSEQLDSRLTYSEDGARLMSVLGPKRKVKLVNGSEVEARLSTRYFYDEGAPEEGGPYELITKQTEGALVGGVEHDVKIKTFGYGGQSGLGWKLGKPTSETDDPAGLSLTTVTLYDAKTGDIIETRMPSNPQGGDASATQIIHYSAGASEVAGCGNHPEWAGLTCQIRPAAQPGTPGLPNLPVSTTTYNVYNEPLVTTEVAGANTRVASVDYDAAGRPVGAAISSTSGKPLPEVHTVYDEEMGLPAVVNTETQLLISEYDSLGRRISYTDADGNVSTYEYDILGRVTEVFDGKGSQAFGYDATTGDLTKIEDSAIGAMTAEYDSGGKMTSMAFPNGLEARYGYDGGGFATVLEYVKTTGCSEKCVWFEESQSPSVHGKILSQNSSLAKMDYTYDAAGRLTRAQETPQGKGCTTRLYTYDANTNRTSATLRGPGEGGACAQVGGETQTTAFDKADRLLGTGVSYNAFGNITALPKAYAGGSALSSSYYADDTAASLTQSGKTTEYLLDPAGRERETVFTEGANESAVTSHFSGDSDSPAWTEDDLGSWTRYISSLGGMAAIQSSTEGIDLQLVDLQGNIVATVPYGGSEKPEFMEGATEYGVPRGSSPAKYSWLGASQRSTELDSGVVNMGARTYVPAIGRFLQADPVPGGSANAYAYVFGDPVGESDLSGEYTPGSAPTWLTEFMENPPGMPPPPPDPEVEVELEEEELWDDEPEFLFLPVSVVPVADAGETIAEATVGIWLKIVQVVAKKAGEIASLFGRSAARTFKTAVRYAINAAKGGARTVESVAGWVKREFQTRVPELIQCGHAAYETVMRHPGTWGARAAAAGASCITAIRRYRNG